MVLYIVVKDAPSGRPLLVRPCSFAALPPQLSSLIDEDVIGA
jgi:hypothetical protein